MYLTHLSLPDRVIPDVHILHTLTMAGFPNLELGSQARAHFGVLFQVVGDRDIMVQSDAEPDPETWDGLGITVTTRVVDRQVAAGQQFMLRTVVNPTRSVPAGPGKRGYRVGIHDDDAATEWVTRRLEAAGFHVEPNQLRVGPEISMRSHRRRSLRVDTREVTAQVTVSDPDPAQQTIRTGLGRSAAYGCGMLLLRPAAAMAT
ncbi:type I-E CRISPR-associated protein Cas6/Cse3/CasE [Brachybacterium hainanense]|uniref:Type I-E CRISPR-associated protein Cas6/Cse3/CasE n=1 Tax=Brachybacterium hainanense TaxID=1541174 RepID=A0ABV6RA83_9MICO